MLSSYENFIYPPYFNRTCFSIILALNTLSGVLITGPNNSAKTLNLKLMENMLGRSIFDFSFSENVNHSIIASLIRGIGNGGYLLSFKHFEKINY